MKEENMAKINPGKVKEVHFKAQLEHAVLVLNQVNELDPTVLPELIDYRVSCNKALADHPTVRVGKWSEKKPFGLVGEDKGYEVGLLGILNGLFGVKENGYGYIAARYADDPDGLSVIKCFEVLE